MGIIRKLIFGAADALRVPAAMAKDVVTCGGRYLVDGELYTTKELRKMRQEEASEEAAASTVNAPPVGICWPFAAFGFVLRAFDSGESGQPAPLMGDTTVRACLSIEGESTIPAAERGAASPSDCRRIFSDAMREHCTIDHEAFNETMRERLALLQPETPTASTEQPPGSAEALPTPQHRCNRWDMIDRREDPESLPPGLYLTNARRVVEKVPANEMGCAWRHGGGFDDELERSADFWFKGEEIIGHIANVPDPTIGPFANPRRKP